MRMKPAQKYGILIQTAALGSWFKSKGEMTVKGLLTC